MPIEPGDSAHARALGYRGGQLRRRLTLEDVETELGALDTPGDAQRWLRQAYLWAAARLVPGTTANAMVRAAEVWLKAHDAARIEPRLRALEAQLRQASRQPA